MMKLSTMLKVDSTLDSQWRSHIAERILERWEHDQGTARFFRSSANFVYTFLKGGERYFLRFVDTSERTVSTIEVEMALLNWLANKGMIVTTPIMSMHGRWVEMVETGRGTFHAVVFTKLEGEQLNLEELSIAQFEAWGAALGKLHATMGQYREPNLSKRPTWRDQLDVAQSYVSSDEPKIQAELDSITSLLSAFPVTEMNYGLIHGDFELDNLFWQNNTIAMLDFDDCFYCWHVADIALALRDLFEAGVDLNNPSFRVFIRGYSAHHVLAEELHTHLPTFMRFSNLMMYAKLVRAMDLVEGHDYPEWCTSLRQKLAQRMQTYKTSLLK
ncbi:phosphotransferase enzyme family protein [Ktedonospora formicarum]|uniref:Aminoglycoside phosphotransferase domain-containing protein n=1 Tax=Ktedonospora formicarum TaxID=2778364 RepID=A0A8J3I4A7_9CHLR|nr:phosphotransferase [Ktedonospora formicarum]GHO46688.1 hypothetical protein KSX_48510 [Ktedonospora formicarum]